MKSARFCFTKNNYSDVDVSRLSDAEILRDLKYVCFGKEVGASGTPHLQGYLEFHHNMKLRISACQRRIQDFGLFGFHVEIARGTAQQNIDYCSKDGDFTEVGERPKGQGFRSDLQAVTNAINEGDTMIDLIEKFPVQVIKFQRGIEFLIATKQPRRFFKTEVWWLWGPSGSGKSRWAWDQSPEAYMKCSSHKWWNGYVGQEIVILDDYRPSKEMPFSFMLNLMDRYPLSVETKGGMVEFVSKKIYVTSPFSPEHVCDHLDWIGTEQKAQFLRRIDHTIQFPQIATMYLT